MAQRQSGSRSRGLSFRMSLEMAHSGTDRMRWRTARVFSAFTYQVGVRMSSRSAESTSDPLPMRGETYRCMSLLPILRGPPAASAAAILFEHALGGLGEGRKTLAPVPLREEVDAPPGQHAIGEGLLAGLDERDERVSAEPEFAAPAADDEPLDPASGSARLDEQIQAVAIYVLATVWGTDEGGREGLVGIAGIIRVA